MDSLPKELLEKIAGHLNLQDQLRLGQTSRLNRDVYHGMVELEHKKQFGETDKPVALKANDLLLQSVLKKLNKDTVNIILRDQYLNYFTHSASTGYLRHARGATVTTLAQKLITVRDRIVASYPEGAIRIKSDFLAAIEYLKDNHNWNEDEDEEGHAVESIYQQLVARLHLLDPSITHVTIDSAVHHLVGLEGYIYGKGRHYNAVGAILANLEELSENYMTTIPNVRSEPSRWSLPGRRRHDAFQRHVRSKDQIKVELLEATQILMNDAQLMNDYRVPIEARERKLSDEDYATLDRYCQHVYRQQGFTP